MQINKTQSTNFQGMYRVTGTSDDFIHLAIKTNDIINEGTKIKVVAQKNFGQFELFNDGKIQTRLFCTKNEAEKLLDYKKETYEHVVKEEEYLRRVIGVMMGIKRETDKLLDHKLALRKFFNENFKKYLPDYDKSPEFEAKDILKALDDDKFDVVNGKML